MDWISVNERLPEDGEYLTVIQYRYGNTLQRYIAMKSYSPDLYRIHHLDFWKYKGKKQGGWYDYDSEYGYHEVSDITHWMPLPELPLDK